MAGAETIHMGQHGHDAARLGGETVPAQKRVEPDQAALAACGVTDYTRASTRITAKLANATQALALQIPEKAPILRSVAINREGGPDDPGRPVEYGRTWFAGDRVSLVLTGL